MTALRCTVSSWIVILDCILINLQKIKHVNSLEKSEIVSESTCLVEKTLRNLWHRRTWSQDKDTKLTPFFSLITSYKMNCHNLLFTVLLNWKFLFSRLFQEWVLFFFPTSGFNNCSVCVRLPQRLALQLTCIHHISLG